MYSLTNKSRPDTLRSHFVGTDGPSVMSLEQAKCVPHIQREAINAKSLHSIAMLWKILFLNQLKSNPSKMPLEKWKKFPFYNQSAKRNVIMNTHLRGQLVSLRETNWVDRHDAIIPFYIYLQEIVESFAIKEIRISQKIRYLHSLSRYYSLFLIVFVWSTFWKEHFHSVS